MSTRAVLLKALASMPSDVQRILTGMDAARTPSPPPSSAAAIANVFDQLRAHERACLDQLRDVISNERPHLHAVQPVAVALENAQPLDELAASFFQARQETLGFLQELSLGAWQRRATHETWGDTSLRLLVQRLVEHDTQHLTQLLGARHAAHHTRLNPVPDEMTSRSSGQRNTVTNSEEKNEHRRTRKWPRNRTRRRGN